MPLDFSNGGSSSLTGGYIRYMASTASWQMRDEPFKFGQAVFDLPNLRTGWLRVATGQAPEWVMDPSLSQRAPRPEGDKWKRGFKVDVYSTAMFGDDEPVKEWGTNSTGATEAMKKLYADWESSKEDGKLPVVEFQGAIPTKVGKGNTNIPIFKIIKYVTTPAGLSPWSMSSPPEMTAASAVQDAEF